MATRPRETLVAQALVAVGERYAGITNPARRGSTSDVLPCVQLETGPTTGLDAHKGAVLHAWNGMWGIARVLLAVR
jgi:hypothetical protein